MTATRHYRLTCRGNTRPVREALKARGWKWDPATQSWYMMLVEAHARRIWDGDEVFRRGLGGQKKGCQLVLDGQIVWTSQTYQATPASGGSGGSTGRDLYNCDARGNWAAGAQIPGSCPDDRI